jgi:protocatechuate 3,4-dioxygenase alpha subunit
MTSAAALPNERLGFVIPIGQARIDGMFEFFHTAEGAASDQLQAPHIVVSVFMRGLLRRLITRIYFPDEPANAEDYAPNLVEPSRQATLIARKSGQREGVLEWNAVLQGLHETVFFDC